MVGTSRRKRLEPTEDWGQLEPLRGWPEQLAREEIRPLVPYGGEPVSRYEVAVETATGKPRSVGRPSPRETSRSHARSRLFALDEADWPKAPKLEGYAPHRSRGPQALQRALFPYARAV